MAQLAFAAGGAFLGNAFGLGIGALGLSGGAVGWTVGSMIGGLFAPTQRVQGPRLTDLKLTQSSYGQPVPYVIGHPRISGQIIWGSDRREIATTTSRRAKGGPKVKSTTYTYEIDLLIKLSCNQMAGIRKIFINGELQWSNGNDADYGTIAASGSLATRITVYNGDPDQLPDPTYEAAVGIGNAPAYRESLTIMLAGLQLGNAGQIPNITFEVMQTAESTVEDHQIGVIPEGGTGLSLSIGTPAFSPNGSTVVRGLWDNSYSNDFGVVYRLDPDGGTTFINTIQAQVSSPAASGITDEAVLVTTAGIATWPDGSRTNLGSTLTHRFAKLNGDIVASGAAGAVGGTMVIRRFNATSRGIPAVDIVAEAANIIPSFNSIAIKDDSVYTMDAVNTNAVSTIRQFDLETLSIAGTTIVTPVITNAASILFDDVGDLFILEFNELLKYTGSGWESVMQLAAGYGASGTFLSSEANNGGALIDGVLYVQSPAGEIRASWIAAEAGDRPLDEVMEELWVRSGLDLSTLDSSALAGQVVRAYAITPSAMRSIFDTLSQRYGFECSQGVVNEMVPLGGAVQRTIPWDDLGTAESGNVVEGLPLVSRNDLEIPAFVTVKGMNVANDYQDGGARSSRVATDSNAEMFVEYAMGMTPQEMQQTADFLAKLGQASTNSVGQISLQTKYTELVPTDVILATDRDGSTYRVRLREREDMPGIIRFQAVFDNAAVLDSDGITDEDYSETSQIRVASNTVYVLGDWPLFRDVDDDTGHYWAATGAGDFWPGAALLKSSDDVVYNQVSQIEERGIVGRALTHLQPYTGPNVPDEMNVVRVNVGSNELASITYEEQIERAGNVFMIGPECIVARVATYVSPGVYDLSGLLRGQKGTDWAQRIDSHLANEDVALIQPAGIRRVPMDIAEWNVDRFYRGVTFGKPIDSGITKVFANTGVSAEPYSATDPLAARDGTNITITWSRRTRLSENWLAGVVPLGEAAQLWEMDVYTDGTYTTIANTYDSTAASVTFANTGATVYFDLYQISERAGRGYPLRGAI